MSYKNWILNLSGALALGAAALEGWLQLAWASDVTHFVGIVGALYVAGTVMALRESWSWVQWLADAAVTVGLMGTVLGMLLAFRDVTPAALANPVMASTAIAHITSVAFYATFTGALTALWFSFLIKVNNEKVR